MKFVTATGWVWRVNDSNYIYEDGQITHHARFAFCTPAGTDMRGICFT